MQTYPLFVGIDVSKLTLSVCIGTSPSDYKVYETTNDATGMAFILKLISAYKLEAHQIVICMEHTGSCTSLLKHTFAADYLLWIVHPHIMGRYQYRLKDHKTDNTDAIKIMNYAFSHQHLAAQNKHQVENDNVQSIKQLQTLRKQMIKKRTASINQLKNIQIEVNPEPLLAQIYQEEIDYYNKKVKEVEARIAEINKSDEAIKANKKLLKSIPGIGDVVAQNLIVITDNFNQFSFSWRKLAAFIGTAPYQYSSGTSIRRRPKVSKKADLGVKANMHQGIISVATRKGQFFYQYYQQMIDSGKHHNWIINAIANMLLKISCAIIKKKEPFDPELFLKNKKSWQNNLEMS